MNKLKDFIKTEEGDYFKELELKKDEKQEQITSRTHFLTPNNVNYK